MPDAIQERVARYLGRHIAWFEKALHEMQDFREGLPIEQLDGLAALQKQREAELTQLMLEHQGLLREWRAASVATHDREHVRALAARAEVLQNELRQAYGAALAYVQQAAADNAATSSSLRQGRDLLDKYRHGGRQGGAWFDQQA